MVYLVEDDNHRLATGVDFGKGLVYHGNLLLEVGVADVHHVEQQVGFADFVEGGFERFHEAVGQFADESHRVGEQEGEVSEDHLAHSGVEGGEELILGQHFRVGEHIHYGGLADVGVAHEGHAHVLVAVAALCFLLLVDFLETALEQGDALADDASVGFDFLLARAAHTDTAALFLQVSPHTREAGEQVLVLGQLHLHLGVGGLGALGEDVEDEVGAVHHLAV